MEKYFDRYDKLLKRNFNVNIDKDGNTKVDRIIQPIHRFSKSKIGSSSVTMDICDDSTLMVVDCHSPYEGSDEYLRCFSNFVHRLLGSDPYIELTRLGIRKIDYVTKAIEENIDTILEDQLLGTYADKGNPIKKEYKDFLQYHNETQINLTRVVERINDVEREQWRLSFDVDAYLTGDRLNRGDLRSPDSIYRVMSEKLNAPLFDLFVYSFKEDYIDQFYEDEQ